MTTEDDFHRALDANPDDHHTRLVFADWLQEHDDPRAEGYRALGNLSLQPVNYKGSHWFSWQLEGYPKDNTSLPKDWFDVVPKEHGSGRRDAEDAAALAFAQLPHARRQELLGQQSAEKLTRRRLARRTYRHE